jgi:hypothetical protein
MTMSRMPPARPHRQVVPDDRVVFEEVLQPLGQAQFAASVETGGAEGGDQRGHPCSMARPALTRGAPAAVPARVAVRDGAHDAADRQDLPLARTR